MLAKNSSDKNSSYYNFSSDITSPVYWSEQQIGDGGVTPRIRELMESKERNTKGTYYSGEAYFDYLLELNEEGEALYDIIWRVIYMYRKGFYEAVPNTVRVFYECLIHIITPHGKFIKKKDSNVINYYETLENMFFVFKKPCDRKIVGEEKRN